MATLTAAISSSITEFSVSGDVSAARTKQEYRIDDEVILLRSFKTTHATTPRPETDRTRWLVYRGQAGTVAASHLIGAEIFALNGAVATATESDLVEPAPFAGTGTGGGVTVDPGDDTPVPVTGFVVPGAVIVGDEATLGKWTLVGTGVGVGNDADLSVSVTQSGEGEERALANRTASGTGGADAFANTTVTVEDGDAEAKTTVTVTGVQDGLATTTVVTAGGTADVTITATADGNAFASSAAASSAGSAQAKSTASAGTTGEANATVEANSQDGLAVASSLAFAFGDGNATVDNGADTAGSGLARASLTATNDVRSAGVLVLADATSARMGFNGATPIAKPTGVAVTAEAIHAALVNLGLISA